jgi:transcriptional regulator of acetoin/glycerol metabolism
MTAEMFRMERRDRGGRRIEQILVDAFQAAGGDRDEAARLLGIGGATFWRWCDRLGLERQTTLRRRPKERKPEVPA